MHPITDLCKTIDSDGNIMIPVDHSTIDWDIIEDYYIVSDYLNQIEIKHSDLDL
jgi:hypothetical protein